MKYLITSALPYINGIKHLGNLIGSMLPADVYTRFLREQGHEVLFICGTDEHGTPCEIAAIKENLDIKDYCDKMHYLQKQTYDGFNLSFDYFGRSSSPSNHELTKEIFYSLDQNGFIEEKTIKQFYSIDEDRFLPDRYIIGICPKCDYKKARGDQCDGCGALLDPTDIKEPRSWVSGSQNLELRESKHLFLRLQDEEGQIKKWIDTHPDWPPITKGIAYKWLNEGLKERCITRDLKWGVKVPKKGYENKVFYVWFDAPIAYISMTKDYTSEWESWWLNTDNVRYVQFMAKDNVPFHAIFFPAMLMASQKPWKLVDYLKATSWLNYDGGKFSTSQNRGIFLDQALELFPTDYWRYYLMANIPETSDSDFTFDNFAQIINKDLADVLGNLINRVFVLAHKHFNGKLKNYSLPSELKKQIKEFIQKFNQDIELLKFRSAMQNLRSLWAAGNEYITKAQPWSVIKNDKNEAEKVLSNALIIIYYCAIKAAPVIPETSQKILKALNIQSNKIPENWELKKIEPLFQKITEEKVIQLSKYFSGEL